VGFGSRSWSVYRNFDNLRNRPNILRKNPSILLSKPQAKISKMSFIYFLPVKKKTYPTKI